VLAKRLEMNTAEGVPESESFDAHYRGSEDSTSGVHFSASLVANSILAPAVHISSERLHLGVI
jgi:hypothetical protein